MAMSVLDVVYELIRCLPLDIAAKDAVVKIQHEGLRYHLSTEEPIVINEDGHVVLRTTVD